MSAHEHDSTPAPVAPPRRGRLVRALGWGVALPLALLVGGGAWLAGTQSGLDAALGLAARAKHDEFVRYTQQFRSGR